MLQKRVDYRGCPDRLSEFLNEYPAFSGFVYILLCGSAWEIEEKVRAWITACALIGQKGFLVKREGLSRFCSLTAGYHHRKTFQKKGKKGVEDQLKPVFGCDATNAAG
jgi:hypothetical protein